MPMRRPRDARARARASAPPHAAQDLGVALVQLREAQLEALELPREP